MGPSAGTPAAGLRDSPGSCLAGALVPKYTADNRGCAHPLPPGCHGNLLYTGLSGTRQNGTGTATVEKDCKSAPHHGFSISLPQVQSPPFLSQVDSFPRSSPRLILSNGPRFVARIVSGEARERRSPSHWILRSSTTVQHLDGGRPDGRCPRPQRQDINLGAVLSNARPALLPPAMTCRSRADAGSRQSSRLSSTTRLSPT